MYTPEPGAQTRVTPVIPGELKSKIDRVWDAFWSGGISNPLEVIEQITYLLFIRRLDDIQTLAEKKARVTKTDVESPVLLPGQAHLRRAGRHPSTWRCPCRSCSLVRARIASCRKSRGPK